jgi:hypothetical protein
MSLLVALVLAGHAVMHIGAVACGLLSGSMTPWVVADAGIDLALVKSIAVILASVTVIASLLAALAAAGICVPRTWWRPLASVASAASAVLLIALFSPMAVPGLVIDVVLLWLALVRWQPEPGFGRRTRNRNERLAGVR